MTGRDLQETNGRLWKALGLAVALAAFGSTSLESSASAEEIRPMQPEQLTNETVKEALLELADKSAEFGIAGKNIEFLIIGTSQQGELYPFYGPTLKVGSSFTVGGGNKVFDVPKDQGGANGNLWPVPSTGNVIILYDFSPGQVGVCVGNQCQPVP
jgi:hypothetical protein